MFLTTPFTVSQCIINDKNFQLLSYVVILKREFSTFSSISKISFPRPAFYFLVFWLTSIRQHNHNHKTIQGLYKTLLSSLDLFPNFVSLFNLLRNIHVSEHLSKLFPACSCLSKLVSIFLYCFPFVSTQFKYFQTSVPLIVIYFCNL